MKQVMEEYSDHERKFLAEEKDPSYSPEAEEQEEEDEDEDVVVPSPEAEVFKTNSVRSLVTTVQTCL